MRPMTLSCFLAIVITANGALAQNAVPPPGANTNQTQTKPPSQPGVLRSADRRPCDESGATPPSTPGTHLGQSGSGAEPRHSSSSLALSGFAPICRKAPGRQLPAPGGSGESP